MLGQNLPKGLLKAVVLVGMKCSLLEQEVMLLYSGVFATGDIQLHHDCH
jgi:hypothetical protein